MASNEDMVPKGLPYGERQKTETAMKAAGIPAASSASGASSAKSRELSESAWPLTHARIGPPVAGGAASATRRISSATAGSGASWSC